MENITIIVAFVSGLFALLGGFFGALLSRRTEYEKWLRQERSIAFAEFINQSHKIQNQAVDIIYDSSISIQERDIKITEIFNDLTSQENIVRLYLKKNDRKRFSRLKHDMWVAHGSEIEQSERLKIINNIMSDFQDIFEKTIHG